MAYRSEGQRRLAQHTRPQVTQSALADALGVAPATVSLWVSGAHRPPIERLLEIERETGISAADWLRPPAEDPADDPEPDQQAG